MSNFFKRTANTATILSLLIRFRERILGSLNLYAFIQTFSKESQEIISLTAGYLSNFSRLWK